MNRLDGLRVLIMRPDREGDDLVTSLTQLGADVISVPAVEIAPPSDLSRIDEALRSSDKFDWMVFTSVNGVDVVLRRAGDIGLRPRPRRFAAIGPATAKALGSYGIEAGFIPTSFTTTALAEQLPHPGSTCLFRADIAEPALETRLSQRGFDVTRVDAYVTLSRGAEEIREALALGVDAIAITSASIARSFADAAGVPPAGEAPIFCIGPATASQCRRVGLDVAAEADEHTSSGLVKALVEHFAHSG